MEFGTVLADIGRVAIKVEPEVFYLRVAERLENTPVELMAGRVRCPKNRVSGKLLCVRPYLRRIGDIQSEPPHASHASSKFLFSSATPPGSFSSED